jgi:hypothetical protein
MGTARGRLSRTELEADDRSPLSKTYRSNSYARSRARVPWLKPVT